jgi:hypothetical protein
MRRRAWVAVVLGAVLLMVTPAGAQTVALSSAGDAVDQTVDTVTSTATNAGNTVTSTATDAGNALDDTVDSVTSTASDAGDAVGGTLDTVTSTAGQAAGAAGSATGSTATILAAPVTGTNGGAGGSTSGDGSTSSGSSTTSGSSGGSARSSQRGDGKSGSRATRHRTKFDRLPRRFETLLERIEFGRNVRANIRRLEHLLASASPAVRARVLRLLRAEIRRLRADGVTRAERSRIERLELARKALRTSPSAAAAAQTPSGSAPPHRAEALRTADGSVPTHAPPPQAADGGVLAEQTGGSRVGAEEGGVNGATGTDGLPPVPQLPDQPDEFPFAIGLILLALVGLGLAGVVASVAARVVGRARSG